MDGRFSLGHAPPRRPRRLSVDCGYIVTGANKLAEGRHGEIGRAHENDTKSHSACAKLFRACILTEKTGVWLAASAFEKLSLRHLPYPAAAASFSFCAFKN